MIFLPPFYFFARFLNKKVGAKKPTYNHILTEKTDAQSGEKWLLLLKNKVILTQKYKIVNKN